MHGLDAAVLFRRALESAPAGTSWHAVADEGDAVRDVAEAIGRRLGLPIQAGPAETYGPLGAINAADQPASATHNRQALGWAPTNPGFLEELGDLRGVTHAGRFAQEYRRMHGQSPSQTLRQSH